MMTRHYYVTDGWMDGCNFRTEYRGENLSPPPIIHPFVPGISQNIGPGGVVHCMSSANPIRAPIAS